MPDPLADLKRRLAATGADVVAGDVRIVAEPGQR